MNNIFTEKLSALLEKKTPFDHFICRTFKTYKLFIEFSKNNWRFTVSTFNRLKKFFLKIHTHSFQFQGLCSTKSSKFAIFWTFASSINPEIRRSEYTIEWMWNSRGHKKAAWLITFVECKSLFSNVLLYCNMVQHGKRLLDKDKNR